MTYKFLFNVWLIYLYVWKVISELNLFKVNPVRLSTSDVSDLSRILQGGERKIIPVRT